MIRITVLKTLYNQELAEEYRRPDSHKGPCPRYNEEPEFYVKHIDEPPEGFCMWAWNDIHKFVLALMTGADFAGMKEVNTFIASCTDGIKPVIFKLERIAD
jgi:uncharacterized repeat protein (TIGR04076 family)